MVVIELLMLRYGSGEFTPPRFGDRVEQCREAIATAQQCNGRERRIARGRR
jgi:hypothetical protein